jgi:hypothetical protein
VLCDAFPLSAASFTKQNFSKCINEKQNFISRFKMNRLTWQQVMPTKIKKITSTILQWAAMFCLYIFVCALACFEAVATMWVTVYAERGGETNWIRLKRKNSVQLLLERNSLQLFHEIFFKFSQLIPPNELVFLLCCCYFSEMLMASLNFKSKRR